MNTSDFFHTLVGQWEFTRLIDAAAQSHRAEGIATFTPTSERLNTLYYYEQGRLDLNANHLIHFYQAYLYHYHPTRTQIEIYFVKDNSKKVNQNQLFHTLQFSLNATIAEHSHACQKDTYHIRYKQCNPEMFTIHYQVYGPRKNYHSHTLFKRAGASTLAPGL